MENRFYSVLNEHPTILPFPGAFQIAQITRNIFTNEMEKRLCIKKFSCFPGDNITNKKREYLSSDEDGLSIQISANSHISSTSAFGGDWSAIITLENFSFDGYIMARDISLQALEFSSAFAGVSTHAG